MHGRSGVNPFKGVENLTLQPTEQGRLFEELRQIQKDINDWKVFNESLAAKLGRESKPSLVSTKYLISVIEVLKSCPPEIDQYINLAVGLSEDSRFRESIGVGRVWVECKAKLSDTFNDLAWNHNISSLREPILSGVESWWQRVFGKYRAASRELHSLLKIDLPKEPSERLALLDSLINAQQKLKAFNDESSYLEQSLGAHWRGDKTNFDPIQITLNWVSSGSGVIKEFTAQEIISLKSEDSLMSADYSAFSGFEQSLIERVSSVLDQLDVDLLGGNQIHVIDLLALNERFELMSASPESYSSWCDYCVTQKRLEDLGLGSLSTLIESEGFSGERAVDEYLYSLCESRWEAILTAKPQLSSLRDLDRHELVKLFQVLDKDRVGEVRTLYSPSIYLKSLGAL